MTHTTTKPEEKREIKFRGYSSDLKKWFYGSLVNLGWGTFILFDDGFERRQRVEYDSIGQYTGLQDKNGNGIYEGDVIRTSRGDWGVIVYKAPFFEVTVSADQSSTYSREWFDTVEIIGNIYENPELLTTK